MNLVKLARIDKEKALYIRLCNIEKITSEWKNSKYKTNILRVSSFDQLRLVKHQEDSSKIVVRKIDTLHATDAFGQLLIL